MVTAEELESVGLASGLCAVGVTVADPFEATRVVLETRKREGLHGGMEFTYRNPARSTDPGRTLPDARSLVVGALDYQRERPPRPAGPTGRVAAYSWEDHYSTLGVALEVIADRLRADGHRAVVLADQNHLVDRAAAHRAGLGWWGKNSNLLVPGVGSLVVLGAVLTDAPLEVTSQPVDDGCGSCRRCVESCPTEAIVAPGVVDARRCLAWLVQAEGIFAFEFRELLGDRIYGCDDCQDVCPPNLVRRRCPSDAGAGGAWADVLEMLEAGDEQLLAGLGRWYIPRRDPDYLRRNALLVLGNVADPTDGRVMAAVRCHLASPSPMLRAHAVWAALRLGFEELLVAAADDTDQMVQAELARRDVAVSVAPDEPGPAGAA